MDDLNYMQDIGKTKDQKKVKTAELKRKARHVEG